MSRRIVAILNQKGGVGKTTTAVNLCHALARMGQRIAVIDLDPQCHLSVSLGVRSNNRPGVDEAMLGGANLDGCAVQARENLWLIPPGPRLQEIEQLSQGETHRGDLLAIALANSLTEIDSVFIDCPPSSGILVANALMAADEILIPMTSDYLALQGLSHLMGTLLKFEAALNKHYLLRLVMSRYVPTRRLSQDVLRTLGEYFSGKILATPIRETGFLAECPSFGKTIFEYRPGCRSARDFNALARDFLSGTVI